MARLVLGVTGSVAAIRTPSLYAALRGMGHRVRLVATEPALYFFNPSELAADPEEAGEGVPAGPVLRDRDEWPGERYRRGDPVLHIELRNWADCLVVAPLDANTLAKLALGLSDNFLSCLFRAWDFRRPVVLAPAMNTLMWESPITARHLGQIFLDRGDAESLPADWSLDSAPAHFARDCPGVVLVPPQAKRLACGDVGMGAMAEVVTIAEAVRSWAEHASEHP